MIQLASLRSVRLCGMNVDEDVSEEVPRFELYLSQLEDHHSNLESISIAFHYNPELDLEGLSALDSTLSRQKFAHLTQVGIELLTRPDFLDERPREERELEMEEGIRMVRERFPLVQEQGNLFVIRAPQPYPNRHIGAWFGAENEEDSPQ